MDNYKLLIGLGLGAIGAMSIVFGMDLLRGTVAIHDYDIYVDPLLDRQNLFTTGRVTIQNTGAEQLTGVRVNFGGGDVLELGTLDSGEKVIVSPPSDNGMKYVIVTADPDIFVNKAYREPPKMVGMMGS